MDKYYGNPWKESHPNYKAYEFIRSLEPNDTIIDADSIEWRVITAELKLGGYIVIANDKMKTKRVVASHNLEMSSFLVVKHSKMDLVEQDINDTRKLKPIPGLVTDEYIAMKMLTRFKELRKEQPNKPHPDIGWMLDLLEVVREYI